MLTDTQKFITELLTQPLTAKKIYFELRKRGVIMTYQGVHKTLQQMGDTHILQKIEKEYILNKDWVREQKNILDQLVKGQMTPETILRKLEKETEVTFTLDGIMGMGYFLLYFFDALNKKGNRSPFIVHNIYIYNLLVLSGAEYLILKRIVDEHTCTVLSSRSRIWDQIMQKMWQQVGATTAIGTLESQTPCDTFIMSPYVVHVFWPKGYDDWFGTEFEASRKGDDFNYKYICEVCFEKPCQMTLIVKKDKELADTYEQKTIEILDKEVKE